VPVGAAPIASAPADSSGGTYVSPSQGSTFPAGPLLVAYSVGPFTVSGATGNCPNIAATAYLPGGVSGSQPIQKTSPALGIQTAQSAFITWSYSLPAGINPKQNGAWIGLWEGTVVPYDYPPAAYAAIPVPVNTGLSPMPALLAGKAQYVGALFTSGYNANPALLERTAIAAVVMFTTGPPLPP
jgi:hypothetical protein